MAERPPAKILVTGTSVQHDDELVSVIRAAGFEVCLEPWHSEVPALVESQAFGAIVVHLPLPGVGLGVLLSSIRARAARCRQAGLVILTPESDIGAVEKLVGRGVNRVLPNSATAVEVLEALEVVQGVAQRVSIRLPVQLEVTLPAGDSQAFCQTENLSESGMLLRGFQHYPLGTRFSFQLQVPGTDRCLKGIAEVTRTTDAARENVEGFGARFVEVEPSEWLEFERILIEKNDPVH
ncbi:MAG: PilZ domain-containing protein [Acidobacteriota bacterium]